MAGRVLRERLERGPRSRIGVRLRSFRSTLDCPSSTPKPSTPTSPNASGTTRPTSSASRPTERKAVMTVRDASREDAADIYRLLCDFATSYRPERAVFEDRTFPRALAAAADGAAEFLVAEQTGAVVGYLLAARVPTLFAGGTVMDVLELAVDEAHRGRGTGSLLVRAAVTKAAASGDVEVTVPTRRAVEFYKRLGFTEAATYLKYTPGRETAAANGDGP
ncbi:GNAT family N-acetyltransferase [Glycomyces rhizosphaerae]|uniref:GNAT family N-acetyltransferase n=1 Tax=Glycomyces rhizosphaerae TaxID=2054422 RepID=A0ABV7PYQ2_9ACTN